MTRTRDDTDKDKDKDSCLTVAVALDHHHVIARRELQIADDRVRTVLRHRHPRRFDLETLGRTGPGISSVALCVHVRVCLCLCVCVWWCVCGEGAMAPC